MKKKSKRAANSSSETVAFQVRLDSETHKHLKETAERSEISLNQLVTGILRGAAGSMIEGEGRVEGSQQVLKVTPRKKCLTFGRWPCDSVTQYEREQAEDHGEFPPYNDPGQYWFGLDYTDRGVVRPAR